MNIDALKLVALVAQHGSFAAAARVLDADPSSVSRTVANTEAALGLRLFQRSTRTLSVTEEGQIYLQWIVPLLEEFESAKEAAKEAASVTSGTIRITASVAFAHEVITPALPEFLRRYPGIAVELLPTDAVVDIAANAIDLAVRLAPAPRGDLISTKLMSTRYNVYASPAYLERRGSITDPRELVAHNCLRFALPEYRTRWRFRRAGEAACEVVVSGNTVIANALSLRRAAVDGLGPALLADWLVRRELEAGSLLTLFPEHECTATEFETAAWILYPSRAFLPRKVRVMIDYLKERATST